ncbi:MAG: OmpA family protein, partial [Sphingobacteriales bacterium]
AGSKKSKGANFYLGASIPINKRKLKDRDGDKVSNKMDKCPDVLGDWANLGCPPPDKDGDGIVDSLDKCPEVKGTTATNGCPDRDNDGIADGDDLCPDQPGGMATKGCPDRDNDQVADKDDLCPDVAGEARYKGCPDTDGDGVPDNEDKCVDKAGPAAQQGCPDTDNDGIPDNEDKCPTVAGTRANGGCPEVKEEVRKRLAFAATAIQFETGKATIKKQSFKLLDEIVGILNEYGDYKMTIDGHTDNVGKPAKNLELSKARAASVKNYFVSKGIADDRIETDGHGDTQPKASNKTAAGIRMRGK